MRIHDAVVAIETTVQDAQKALAKSIDDPRMMQFRVEFDGLWNALKLIASTLDDSVGVRD